MAARKSLGGAGLPPLADLFSTNEERALEAQTQERVMMLPVSELHDFPGHPFQVRDDEEMEKLAESITQHGVLMPGLVRPRAAGGYEIVAGHRRKFASMKAGIREMPVIVRDMDDDTAVILMVDSNVQRENVLPSEKARAYKMKLDAIKRRAGRPSKENSRQLVGNYFYRLFQRFLPVCQPYAESRPASFCTPAHVHWGEYLLSECCCPP